MTYRKSIPIFPDNLGKMVPGDIICGVDPGFARLGYAFIRQDKHPVLVESGCIETQPGEEQAARIHTVVKELENRIKIFNPKRIALERIFFAKNQKTALKIAEIRGALLLTASSLGLEIKEYAPNEIKLAVTGSGAADKLAIRKMIQLILKIGAMPKLDDETDAIAVALCSLYS